MSIINTCKGSVSLLLLVNSFNIWSIRELLASLVVSSINLSAKLEVLSLPFATSSMTFLLYSRFASGLSARRRPAWNRQTNKRLVNRLNVDEVTTKRITVQVHMFIINIATLLEYIKPFSITYMKFTWPIWSSGFYPEIRERYPVRGLTN